MEYDITNTVCHYENPKVTLRDSTDINKLVDYFRESRPEMTLEQTPSLQKILNMGFALNGIQTYVFTVRASLLFRDLMLSLRDIPGAWAISNRVAKINSVSTPLSSEAEILDEKSKNILRAHMTGIYKRLLNGELQEVVKRDLPLMAMTTFTVAIDLRNLLNFVYTLECHSDYYYNLIGKQFLKEANLEELYKVHPKRDRYPDLSVSDKDRSSGRFGTMVRMYKPDVSFNLQAQLIRKNIIVKSGMWNLLNDNLNELLKKYIQDGIPVSVYLTEDDLLSLTAVRTCWFAMMDKSDNNSWDYLLSDIIKDETPAEFLRGLSCRGCGDKCVILQDMLTKVRHEDTKYPPCPLLLEDPSVVEERINKYNSNSTIMQKWRDCCSTGIIPYNPDNEYYKEYHKNDPHQMYRKWTSDLIVNTDIDFDVNAEIDQLTSEIESSEDNKVHNPKSVRARKDLSDILGEDNYYDFVTYGDRATPDATGLLKGYAIYRLHMEMKLKDSISHVISFGGDIQIFNKDTRIKVTDKFYINRSNGCIFTSNNKKRLNHIYISESNDKVGEYDSVTVIGNNPVVCDYWATKMYSEGIKPDGLAFFTKDDYPTMEGFTIYCASPFFTEDDKKIRDEMISHLTRAKIFRPDETEASKSYDVSPGKELSETIFSENISHIENSDIILFPKRTSDLGTLLEVGYALQIGKPILSYDNLTGIYELIDIKKAVKDIISDKINFAIKNSLNIVVDLNSPGNAILLGYLLGLGDVYYRIPEGKHDNIMLANAFNRVDNDLNILEKNYDEID